MFKLFFFFFFFFWLEFSLFQIKNKTGEGKTTLEGEREEKKKNTLGAVQ
jgi:hypothetical protein